MDCLILRAESDRNNCTTYANCTFCLESLKAITTDERYICDVTSYPTYLLSSLIAQLTDAVRKMHGGLQTGGREVRLAKSVLVLVCVTSNQSGDGDLTL